MLAAAHTPGGFGGVSQKVGRDFMHADQAVGRVGAGREGKALGGGTANPFAATRHVQDAIRLSAQPVHRLASGGSAVTLKPLDAVSDALHTAGQMSRGHLAAGGSYNPPHPAFGETQDFRDILSPTAGGIIASEIPGRTDHIPTSVAADSFVIPADVVSGVGEGNTLAGARIIQNALSSGPYGIPLPRGRSGGSSIPRPPSAPPGGGRSTTTYTPHFAAGGSAPTAPLKAAHVEGMRPGEVPVVLAGGEMVVDPHVVAHHPNLGNLSPLDRNPDHYRKALNHGTKVLTEWVKSKRKQVANQMLKLPGPKNG